MSYSFQPKKGTPDPIQPVRNLSCKVIPAPYMTRQISPFRYSPSG